MIAKLYPVLVMIPLLFDSSYDRDGNHYLWAWESTSALYEVNDLALRPPISPYSNKINLGHRLIPGCDTTPRRLERVDDQTLVADVPPGSLYAVCLSANPDYNGDGVVDSFDANIFIGYFSAGDARADFNGDGAADAFDIGAFSAANGFTIQPTRMWETSPYNLPEPSGASGIAAGVIALLALAQRRRYRSRR